MKINLMKILIESNKTIGAAFFGGVMGALLTMYLVDKKISYFVIFISYGLILLFYIFFMITIAILEKWVKKLLEKEKKN